MTFLLAQLLASIVMVIMFFTSCIFQVGDGIKHSLPTISNMDYFFGFPVMVIVAAGMITAIVVYMRKAAADWRKWLIFTCWLSSLIFFAIMSAVLYGFLNWCEIV